MTVEKDKQIRNYIDSGMSIEEAALAVKAEWFSQYITILDWREVHMFNVGHRVLKYTGDYQLEGEVRAVLTTKAGKTRYVVEHDMGILHIYSESNLKAVKNERATS